jgi:hypothetical protein
MAPGLNLPKVSKEIARNAKCISRAVVVGKIVPVLGGFSKRSGMARGACGAQNIGSSEGMDERGVGENVARPGAQVAVKVPACLGVVGGAGRKAGVSPFSARGEKPRRPTNSRKTSAVLSWWLCARPLRRLQPRRTPMWTPPAS